MLLVFSQPHFSVVSSGGLKSTTVGVVTYTPVQQPGLSIPGKPVVKHLATHHCQCTSQKIL